MNKTIKRFALAPALAVTFGGLAAGPALAGADPLTTEAVDALVLAHCQLDPATPLTLEEMSPVVTGEADVDVVPGEITAHVVRAEVLTSAGDTRLCTVGVLHRDALLPRVAYEGTATLTVGDGLGGVAGESVTLVELGNMGKGAPVDPTAEVDLGGFLTALDAGHEDPSYAVSLDRKALETVQIAVHKSQKDAAARLLKAQVKAADQLLKKQAKAAGKGKHAEKALAAAQRAHDRRVAAAQAAYVKATTPKTVTRPVSHHFTVAGSVGLAG